MKKQEFNTTNSGQVIRFDTSPTFPITSVYLRIIPEKGIISLSEEEVDEFCELLQEKKKEIWQEK